MMRVAAVVAAALLAACGPQATKTETGMAKGNMQPYPKREFASGAPIRPTEGLVAWLDELVEAHHAAFFALTGATGASQSGSFVMPSARIGICTPMKSLCPVETRCGSLSLSP